MPLVLQRALNESIIIGEDIEVTVTLIDTNRIRLMIEAPSHVPVHRKEVFMRLKQEELQKSGQNSLTYRGKNLLRKIGFSK
ncbi:carbon storage regulator [Marinobacter nauticus]|jgi:carbon storage regulator|uniref:carbon storage regulator n=1 Tax=Marinobacter nauticus TaxID=2743 RepID=UPI001C9997EB|nr:carbon storage regulator [Marinobacter nauticus]MBY5963714.1 carbon storage regulator [Marinobacter nauticus]|tara:strand:- start:5333 stop:5575 length:243 start_codon:yes stop_codon:yes gene_type:complete